MNNIDHTYITVDIKQKRNHSKILVDHEKLMKKIYLEVAMTIIVTGTMERDTNLSQQLEEIQLQLTNLQISWRIV